MFSEIFTGGTKTKKIHTAAIITYDKNKTKLQMVALPVVPNTFGNVANWQFSFADNFSAGAEVDWISRDGVNGYWQKEVAYADDNGRVYWLDIALGRQKIKNFQYKDEENKTVTYQYFNNIPRVPKTYALQNPTIKLSSLRLRKDNREKISVTYQIEAKTNNKNIIIGSEFMKLCRAINSKDPPKLYLKIFTAYEFNNYFKGDKFMLDIGLTKEIAERNAYTINDENFDFETSFTNGIFSLSLKHTKNQGYGWIIFTNFASKFEDVIDEDGNEVKQETKNGGKMLLMYTGKDYNDIKLDFFITRD